jgi:hypothetical protein
MLLTIASDVEPSTSTPSLRRRRARAAEAPPGRSLTDQGACAGERRARRVIGTRGF